MGRLESFYKWDWVAADQAFARALPLHPSQPFARNYYSAHLTALGIGCEIYYPVPMHRQECFAKLPEHSLSDCAVSDLLASEVLSIPVFAELRRDQLDEVIAAVASFLS